MRLIVIGGSGSIGHSVLRLAQQFNLPTLGTYLTRHQPSLLKFDATTQDLGTIVPDLGQNDVVFLLAAVARVNAIEQNESAAHTLNVLATKRLIQEVVAHKAMPIFMSTNQVFDGRSFDGYFETSQTNPMNAYAEHKVEIEEFISSLPEPWAILRTGWNISSRNEDPCVIQETYRTLLQADAKMATDNIINITDVHDTAAAMLKVARQRMSGILHCANPEAVRRTDLADLIRARSRRGSEMAYKTVSFDEFKFSAARPARAWLRSERSKELNLSFKPLKEVVFSKVDLIDQSTLECQAR